MLHSKIRHLMATEAQKYRQCMRAHETSVKLSLRRYLAAHGRTSIDGVKTSFKRSE